MNYRVVVMPSAEAAIFGYVDFIANERKQPENAARVLRSIRESIGRLERFPHSAPLAPENAHRDYEIRMRIIASCLVLFNIDEESRTVRVIGFRHGSRLPRPEELPRSPGKDASAGRE